MTKRLITLLAALLVLGFAVAGCGDDESASSGNGDDTAAETVTNADTVTDDQTVTDDVTDTETETGTEEDADTEEDDGGATAPASQAQRIESCERSLDGAKGLSDEGRETLLDFCKKAASGDPDDVREAGRELCESLRSGGAPSGLPSCKDSGR
jgi:hypothetical protein